MNIQGYHSNNRPWNTRVIKTGEIGIELELAFRSEENLEGYLWDLDSITTKAHHEDIGSKNEKVVVETDSSLSARWSVETITGPYALDSVLSMAEEVSRCAGKHRGYVPNSNYGLHVSICTKDWTEMHKAKFVALWHLNKSLICAVSNRQPNHWVRFDDLLPSNNNHPKLSRFTRKYGHYDICNTSGFRSEIRSFKSACRDRLRLLSSIEFVHAMSVYAKDCSIDPRKEFGVCDQQAIVDFCMSKRGNYDHLRKYLAKIEVDSILRPLPKAPYPEKIENSKNVRITNNTRYVSPRHSVNQPPYPSQSWIDMTASPQRARTWSELSQEIVDRRYRAFGENITDNVTPVDDTPLWLSVAESIVNELNHDPVMAQRFSEYPPYTIMALYRWNSQPNTEAVNWVLSTRFPDNAYAPRLDSNDRYVHYINNMSACMSFGDIERIESSTIAVRMRGLNPEVTSDFEAISYIDYYKNSLAIRPRASYLRDRAVDAARRSTELWGSSSDTVYFDECSSAYNIETDQPMNPPVAVRSVEPVDPDNTSI